MVFASKTMVFVATTMLFVVPTVVFVFKTMVFAVPTTVFVATPMVFVVPTKVFAILTMVFVVSTMVFVVMTTVFITLTMVFIAGPRSFSFRPWSLSFRLWSLASGKCSRSSTILSQKRNPFSAPLRPVSPLRRKPPSVSRLWNAWRQLESLVTAFSKLAIFRIDPVDHRASALFIVRADETVVAALPGHSELAHFELFSGVQVETFSWSSEGKGVKMYSSRSTSAFFLSGMMYSSTLVPLTTKGFVGKGRRDSLTANLFMIFPFINGIKIRRNGSATAHHGSFATSNLISRQ